MSLSLGLVGLPNVGKSTLFKAITKKQVDASNYPFCTIDPNVGVVPVPDSRLQELARISHSAKILPTTIEFVDIAGLVAGAHKGEGLGNKFLANIREVDAIIEVVRCFEDPDVTHVAGDIDPRRDIDIINLELVMADLETVNKRLETNRKKTKSGDKEAVILDGALTKIQPALDQGHMASTVTLEDDELPLVRQLNLLTLKPILYVANVAEADISKPSPLTLPNSLTISAKIESELVELSAEEAHEYMETLGIKQSGLDRLAVASYELLRLLTFFTSGEKETRAWTVAQGARAPQAAGRIHTDFEEGFIKAEIVDWKELVDSDSWVNAKEKGLVRLEGKEYVMRDGDVCLFHFQK